MTKFARSEVEETDLWNCPPGFTVPLQWSFVLTLQKHDVCRCKNNLFFNKGSRFLLDLPESDKKNKIWKKHQIIDTSHYKRRIITRNVEIFVSGST